MRKIALLLAVLTILVMTVFMYPSVVEKPLKDGEGPLAVRMDAKYAAPEYHSPLEWWQRHHFDRVNAGDLPQSDCLYCHDQVTSCNNCHSYVGAAAVEP